MQVAIKTFRRTLAEVLSHQNEISADAVIEMRVFSAVEESDDPTLAEDLAELIEESAQIVRGDPIHYSAPIKGAFSDIINRKFERQGFSS